MSRDISLRRLGADPFLSRHSAQLVERALPLREWSCSGRSIHEEQRPLMYTRAIGFDRDVDVAMLPAHVAAALRHLNARAVEVNQNRVSFTGGIFRLVSNWNVLVPFGFGDLTVDSDARHIRYRVSFRQVVIGATVMVGIIAGFIWYESRSWQGLLFIAIGWMWIVGGNRALGISRFEHYLHRVIETAPRLKG
jgi:hypothetical protein